MNNDVAAVADLDGRDLHDFRKERRQEVNGNTLRSQLGVLRQYVRFAELIEAAPRGLAERIRLPQAERKARDGHLGTEMAEIVLEQLRKSSMRVAITRCSDCYGSRPFGSVRHGRSISTTVMPDEL